MQVNSRGNQALLVDTGKSVTSPQIGNCEFRRKCKQHLSGLTLEPFLKHPHDGNGEISQARVSCLPPDSCTNSHFRTEQYPHLYLSKPSEQTDDTPLLIPTGEKLYQCELCDKHYTKKNALVRHSRSHTGEKPYKCTDCNKCFGRMDSLRKHQKNIHTGVRILTCSCCNRHFSRKCDLTKHLLTRTAKRIHKCMHCDRSFARRCDLTRHLPIHTRMRTYGVLSRFDN